MKIIATSEARKHFSDIINKVRYSNTPIAIGRHNKGEVLLIKFPQDANLLLSPISNFNQYGGSFNFLNDETDLYSISDIKKQYV